MLWDVDRPEVQAVLVAIVVLTLLLWLLLA
jgi:hypothetical protein